MPALTLRLSRFALALAACAAATGCGSFNSASHTITDAITPYKPQVVQGNFVSREQVEALKPGMSRQQVREVLGTPLVTSLFHSDRWDYVFTLNRQGIPPQSHQLTVFFKNDALDRFEGDTMPSESEFVTLLDSTTRQRGKVPQLEASEAQLNRFPPPARPSEAAAAPAPAPVTANYPPLEAPVR